MDDTVMMSQEVVWALARHRDADVTVAIGSLLIDVCAASYDKTRDKYVLHVLPEDLADAVRALNRDGSGVDQVAAGAAGEEES